jgi:hypothetical protein
MRVLVTKEDAWSLDNSMFVVQGSWETGYEYDSDLFFLVGVTACGVGESCDNPNYIPPAPLQKAGTAIRCRRSSGNPFLFPPNGKGGMGTWSTKAKLNFINYKGYMLK